MCDAFGDPIASLAGGRFPMGGATVGQLLTNYSVLLVYVLDDNHFHRYFFGIG